MKEGNTESTKNRKKVNRLEENAIPITAKIDRDT